MKQFILAAAVLLMGTTAHAAKFAKVREFKNSNLQALNEAADDFTETYLNYQSTLKVTKLSKPNGRTAQEVREATVKQALHMLCPFFDEEINISLTSRRMEAGPYFRDLWNGDHFDGSDDEAELFTAFDMVINDNDLEVYDGTASGNNTVGMVGAVYDEKNHQIFTFANTNCGSDN